MFSNIKTIFVTLLFIAAYAFPQICSSAPIQWPAAEGGNGHFYELIEGRFLWSQSYEAARSLAFRGAQGHLATLTSFSEDIFVRESVAMSKRAWIGLTDNEAYGGQESVNMPDPSRDGWRWVTDEPVDYVGWCCGAPNDLNGEDFVDLNHEGNGWNDGQGSWHLDFVVEFDTHAVPGDTNNDNLVDITDLNNVRNHFGEGEILGPPVFGEAFPFNGVVDLGDLNLVLNHFGASPQPVPEPASALTMIAGILSACVLRHATLRQ